VICPKHGCTNPAVIWLEKSEESAYLTGKRVFELRTHVARVKLE
jgi:hypothetical protein